MVPQFYRVGERMMPAFFLADLRLVLFEIPYVRLCSCYRLKFQECSLNICGKRGIVYTK